MGDIYLLYIFYLLKFCFLPCCKTQNTKQNKLWYLMSDKVYIEKKNYMESVL